MNTVRLIKFLSTSAAATALLSVSAFANVEPEYNVPEATGSALLLCGAITAIVFARRRLAK